MDKLKAIKFLENEFEKKMNGIVTIGGYKFINGFDSISKMQFLLNSCKLKNCTTAHFTTYEGCRELPIAEFETLVGTLVIYGHDKWEILFSAIKSVEDATTQEDIDTIVNNFTL